MNRQWHGRQSRPTQILHVVFWVFLETAPAAPVCSSCLPSCSWSDMLIRRSDAMWTFLSWGVLLCCVLLGDSRSRHVGLSDTLKAWNCTVPRVHLHLRDRESLRRHHIYIYNPPRTHPVGRLLRSLCSLVGAKVGLGLEYRNPVFHNLTHSMSASHQDHTSEAILLLKFMSSPKITTDPNKATLFIVPSFTGTLWSYTEMMGRSRKEYRRAMQPHVPHLSASTRRRHLFLFSLDRPLLPHSMLRISVGSMFATLGPRVCPGDFVIPSANPNPFYSTVKPLDTQRDIWMLYAGGHSDRPYREVFGKYLQTKHDSARVGNHTIWVDTQTDIMFGNRHSELQARSVFCPILPGHSTYTKRLFDVIQTGCIPVVFEYPSHRPQPSWWASNSVYGHGYRPVWSDMVPFVDAFPWQQVVLPMPWQSVCNDTFIDLLLAVSPAEVRARQELMAQSRHMLRFDPTGSQQDAFSMFLAEVTRFQSSGQEVYTSAAPNGSCVYAPLILHACCPLDPPLRMRYVDDEIGICKDAKGRVAVPAEPSLSWVGLPTRVKAKMMRTKLMLH